MKEKRQKAVLNFIKERGSVELDELQERFPDVSKVTLRRDLSALEERGEIIRTFGGATAAPQENLVDEFSRRVAKNYEAKEVIALQALKLMEDRGTIFLDAGSTTFVLAQQIPEGHYSVVTNAPNLALEINEKALSSLIVLGGVMGRESLSLTGHHALRFLNEINIDLAFMGASGFSLESGFTNVSYHECDLKALAIEKCRTAVVLLDSSKVGLKLPFTFAQPGDVDCIITEKRPEGDLEERLREFGTRLIYPAGDA